MTTIYAPLNAVDTHRTIRTILPADVELTKSQYNELLSLEKRFITQGASNNIARDFTVQSTTNPGIHYFCVENKFALLHLSANPNLSPVVVFLLVNRWTTEVDSFPLSIMFNLLSNKVVTSYDSLFKFVYNKICESGVTKQNILDTFVSQMSVIPVGLFMFMFEEIGLNGTGHIKFTALNVGERRVKEINGWLANHEDETYQQMATIPFSWVAGMFGFEQAMV